jgi:hypothetical protein
MHQTKGTLPGRDLGGVIWGGYGELYAEMVNKSEGVLDRIPPPLRKYFSLALGDPTEDYPSYSRTAIYNTSYLHRASADRKEAFRKFLELEMSEDG